MIDYSQCIECKRGLPLDYEYLTCCSGYQCGCRGLPTEPPICDDCINKEDLRVDFPEVVPVENVKGVEL